MAYDEKLRRDVGQSTSALKEKASEHAANVASGIEDVAGKMAAQGREASEHMHKVAGNLKAAVDKSVKDQPMATLGPSPIKRVEAMTCRLLSTSSLQRVRLW